MARILNNIESRLRDEEFWETLGVGVFHYVQDVMLMLFYTLFLLVPQREVSRARSLMVLAVYNPAANGLRTIREHHGANRGGASVVGRRVARIVWRSLAVIDRGGHSIVLVILYTDARLDRSSMVALTRFSCWYCYRTCQNSNAGRAPSFPTWCRS